MIDARLIESPAYYDYRRLSLILRWVRYFQIPFFLNFSFLPTWVVVVSLVIFIGSFIWSAKTQRKLQELTQKNSLQFDEHGFELKSAEEDSSLDMPLQEMDKVTVSMHCGKFMEWLLRSFREIVGRPETNYIEVVRGLQKYRYDFELGSRSKARDFKNLIDTWTRRGYPVQTV